jgi:hypothetical protein
MAAELGERSRGDLVGRAADDRREPDPSSVVIVTCTAGGQDPPAR